MSNNCILSLCQDDKGFMWIGTCDGVNIYGGKKIEPLKVYSKNDYISDNIDNLIYTGKNTYWVQTFFGLNKIDQNKNQMTHYTRFSRKYLSIKDNNHNLYVIQNNNYIYYYKTSDNTFKKIRVPGIIYSNVLAFFTDKRNTLWVVMKEYTKHYFIKMNKGGNISLFEIPVNKKYNNPLLYCFYDNGIIYYVDNKYQLYSYSINSGETKGIYNLKDEIKERGKITSILSFHGNIFISFLTNGVIQLIHQRNLLYTKSTINIKCGVFCLKKDLFQDILWIGTDGQGVYLYFNASHSIQSVVLKQYFQQIQSPVRALFIDKNRNLWIGTKGNGIVKLENYEPGKDITECNASFYTKENSHLGNDAVYCFSKSAKGIIWIGDEEGLDYYSYKDRTIKKVPIILNGGIPFKHIHSIYETNNGYIWLASLRMGVVKAHIEEKNSTITLTDIRHYGINNDDFESNCFFSVYANGKEILFANRGYGTYRFNWQTQVLEPAFLNRYENETLNNVLSIQKDNRGWYLIGTASGFLKQRGNKIYLFDKRCGFNDNTIHAILKGSPNSFWLSTNAGLIQFNTTNNKFRNYGYTDGLTVSEFSDNAAYLDDKTGVMYFGGVNGFVTVKPEYYAEPSYMPPIHFNDLSVFGENVNIWDFIKRKGECQVLNLKYDQNFFSIHFSAIDYLNGSNYIYYYRMAGLNKKWINNENNDKVSFTNISPGNYTLQVMYYNRVLNKKSAIYSIKIHIQPPWYQTIWAYISYFIILSMIIYFMLQQYFIRLRRKRKEQLDKIEKEHQKNVFESKLRFFTNIAHEFCTPLSLIYGPCGRILEYKGLNSFVVKYVNIIQSNARRLNNLINELIEFRKIETNNRKAVIEVANVTEIVNDIAKSFVEVAKSREIHFLSKYPEKLEWNTDKGFLNTIVINLISNAFKYTENNKCIKVTAEIDNEDLIIQVLNESNYIKESDLERIFDRYAILNNFEKKSNNDISRNGLGLAISYDMVQSLNGSITVSNVQENEENWICFRVVLPKMKISNEVNIHQTIIDYKPEIKYSINIPLPTFNINSSKPTMLLIDDEVEMLWFISELFSEEFNVIAQKDTEELDKIINNTYINIILCDMFLGKSTGLDVIKKIKESPEMAHIPIIIISASRDINEQIKTMNAGASLYITKPFDTEYLRTSVNQLMKEKEILKNYLESPISSFEKIEGKLTHKESKHFVQEVLSIINNNINNTELSPAFIAKKLSMSQRSLYRKMDEIGEGSPQTLIKQCRLYVARKLLLKTKKTIDEIVFESGFGNKATFFKAFHTEFNMTPKEYRKQNIEEIEGK